MQTNDHNTDATATTTIAKGQRIEFAIPEGWNPPETPEGKDIDLVCSFRVKGQNLCLTKLGDKAMPGYDGKSDEQAEHKPDYSAMAKSIAGNDMVPMDGAVSGAGAGGGY